MKMSVLSNKILKYMVKMYTSDGNDLFEFEELRKVFPDYSDDFLSNAIYLLEHDGFVSVAPADDVAFYTTVLPEGVRYIEKNTTPRKVLPALKELIRFLLK